MRLVVSLAFATTLIVAGCAFGPSATKTIPAPGLVATAEAGSSPMAASSSDQLASSAEAGAIDASRARLRSAGVTVPSGFKPQLISGQVVWCKKIARTGTRFEDQYCINEADIASVQRQNQENRDSFRRNQTICGGSVCSGAAGG